MDRLEDRHQRLTTLDSRCCLWTRQPAEAAASEPFGLGAVADPGRPHTTETTNIASHAADADGLQLRVLP